MTDIIWHNSEEIPRKHEWILLHSFDEGQHNFEVRQFADAEDYGEYNCTGIDGRYCILDWAYCNDLLYCITKERFLP